jgi:hypothetical protein
MKIMTVFVNDDGDFNNTSNAHAKHNIGLNVNSGHGHTKLEQFSDGTYQVNSKWYGMQIY